MSTNLSLPYLSPSQSQKHVTVNESLARLDAIVQLAAVSASIVAQPASPADGSVYIVPAGKSGAIWSGFEVGCLAYYHDGSWEQIAPRAGWLAYVKDTGTLLAWTGVAWQLFPAGRLLQVSATDRLLGRVTAGPGPAEEIACTAAGRALIDDADAAAQRATLGLGGAALKNTGASGNVVPLLDGANTFSAMQRVAPASGAGILEVAAVSGQTAFIQIGGNGASMFSSGFLVWDDAGSANLLVKDARSLNFGTNNTLHWTLTAGGNIIPTIDNSKSLGDASHRVSALYATTGTINTSDARQKTIRGGLSESERRAIRRIMAEIVIYRWNDAIARKGEAARLHCGVTAQAVESAFVAEGLDPRAYALFCRDGEEGQGGHETRLGLRYDQLHAMALAALSADLPG